MQSDQPSDSPGTQIPGTGAMQTLSTQNGFTVSLDELFRFGP